MKKQFYFKQFNSSLVCSVNVKTVLFQRIQLSISTQFITIWTIDRTLSGTTILGWSEPRSDGNEEVLRIPHSSSITGASPSDCLVSYPGQSLQRCSRCILQPQPTGPQIFELFPNLLLKFKLIWMKIGQIIK